jgi:hypothetical protein
MIVRIDEGELNKCTPINQINEVDIKNSDIVIVSDYNKGFLSLQDIKYIGKCAKLSILDSKKKLIDDVVGAYTFVKLNKSEYNNNSHLTYTDNIVVTMGSDGALFQNNLFKSPNPSETIDVSGAGDTFVAAFILKFYKTNNVQKSIEYANKMASIVVSKRGVATPI